MAVLNKGGSREVDRGTLEVGCQSARKNCTRMTMRSSNHTITLIPIIMSLQRGTA